jgi:nucleotide-binding universal stress UspA family protein
MAAVDPDPYDAGRDALNTTILRTAASIARRDGSELHIAHAWMPLTEALLRGRAGVADEEVEHYIRSFLEERTETMNALLKKSRVSASKRRVHLVKGHAETVIPEIATTKEADLLVVGTLNRTGFARWFLANTAEQVLRQVSCDVLVIKPDRLVRPERLKAQIRQVGALSVATERKSCFVKNTTLAELMPAASNGATRTSVRKEPPLGVLADHSSIKTILAPTELCQSVESILANSI